MLTLDYLCNVATCYIKKEPFEVTATSTKTGIRQNHTVEYAHVKFRTKCIYIVTGISNTKHE